MEREENIMTDRPDNRRQEVWELIYTGTWILKLKWMHLQSEGCDVKVLFCFC